MGLHSRWAYFAAIFAIIFAVSVSVSILGAEGAGTSGLSCDSPASGRQSAALAAGESARPFDAGAPAGGSLIPEPGILVLLLAASMAMVTRPSHRSHSPHSHD